MRLKIPGNIDHAIETLNMVVNELTTASTGSPSLDLRNGYLLWWERADAYFRSIFTDSELVDDLYRSQLMVRQGDASPRGLDLASREMNVWSAKLKAAIEQLRSLKVFVEVSGQVVVPDTSAFIEGVYFTDLDWQVAIAVGAENGVRLVIPILVIEELDGLKRDRRAGSRARSVLHKLWELNVGRPGCPAMLPGRQVTAEVFLDEPWHVRRSVNDDEITERAVYLGELTGKPVTLAACDYSMLYRAGAAGLRAVLIERPGSEPADRQEASVLSQPPPAPVPRQESQ